MGVQNDTRVDFLTPGFTVSFWTPVLTTQTRVVCTALKPSCHIILV